MSLIYLALIGLVGHLFLTNSHTIGMGLRGLLASFNNQRGEGEGGDGKPTFTKEQQDFINGVVAKERKATEARFADYNDLKTFKTEYEKSQDQRTQEELVKQKKYEEAEGTYKKQINELSTKLSAKDQAIQDLQISHNLNNEISRQNGHTEETIALLKGSAVLDTNGTVMIKSKGANGEDVMLPVAEGVKKFLAERPHLVKSSHKQGSGSGGDGGAGGAGGAGGKGEETLDSLNAQFAQAMKGTDLKLRSELRAKITALKNAKTTAKA